MHLLICTDILIHILSEHVYKYKKMQNNRLLDQKIKT